MSEESLYGKISEAVKRDYALLSYRLPYKQAGVLEVEGEKIETPPYSFAKMSDIVKKAFEEKYPIKDIAPIGFRGETLVSYEKELEVFATGSAGVIEYRIRRTSIRRG
jgi:hypothetical protein